MNIFGKVFNKYTKFHLKNSWLVVSYTILKFGRTSLRGIYNKGVEEGKNTIIF